MFTTFYGISLIGRLHVAFIIISIASIFIGIFVLPSRFEESNNQNFIKWLKRFATIAAVAATLSVFVPTQKVLIATLVVDKLIEMKIPEISEKTIELILEKIKNE
jgi:hypothetical protein